MSLKTSAASVTLRALVKTVIVAKTFGAIVIVFADTQIRIIVKAEEMLIIPAEMVVLEMRYF